MVYRGLVFLVVGIFFFGIGTITTPQAVWGWYYVPGSGSTPGEPVIDMGPDKQEIKAQQDRQDAADRQAQAKEDAANKAAADANSAAAYRQGKAEQRAKVERLRGKKSTSWQLNH
jgi:hypothetical protein